MNRGYRNSTTACRGRRSIARTRRSGRSRCAPGSTSAAFLARSASSPNRSVTPVRPRLPARPSGRGPGCAPPASRRPASARRRAAARRRDRRSFRPGAGTVARRRRSAPAAPPRSRAAARATSRRSSPSRRPRARTPTGRRTVTRHLDERFRELAAVNARALDVGDRFDALRDRARIEQPHVRAGPTRPRRARRRRDGRRERDIDSARARRGTTATAASQAPPQTPRHGDARSRRSRTALCARRATVYDGAAACALRSGACSSRARTVRSPRRRRRARRRRRPCPHARAARAGPSPSRPDPAASSSGTSFHASPTASVSLERYAVALRDERECLAFVHGGVDDLDESTMAAREVRALAEQRVQRGEVLRRRGRRRRRARS